jgi:hypothetical protein
VDQFGELFRLLAKARTQIWHLLARRVNSADSKATEEGGREVCSGLYALHDSCDSS